MILHSHKKNVGKYNDFLIHKLFQGHEMFYVITGTNVLNIQM
jgi:hypothetical protein